MKVAGRLWRSIVVGAAIGCATGLVPTGAASASTSPSCAQYGRGQACDWYNQYGQVVGTFYNNRGAANTVTLRIIDMTTLKRCPDSTVVGPKRVAYGDTVKVTCSAPVWNHWYTVEVDFSDGATANGGGTHVPAG